MGSNKVFWKTRRFLTKKEANKRARELRAKGFVVREPIPEYETAVIEPAKAKRFARFRKKAKPVTRSKLVGYRLLVVRKW